MASIDFSSDYVRRGRRVLFEFAAIPTLWFVLASLAASTLIVATALYLEGLTGWRLASQNVQRFSFFFFLSAFVIGPLAHLFPSLGIHGAAQERHKLTLVFVAAYAVSLLCVAAPYFLSASSTPIHLRIPSTTMAFLFVGTCMLVVLAANAHEGAARFFGRTMHRLMERGTMIYFWSLFALAAFDHLVGPHRPDGFFGFSLSLLLAGALLRFADDFLARRPGISLHGFRS